MTHGVRIGQLAPQSTCHHQALSSGWKGMVHLQRSKGQCLPEMAFSCLPTQLGLCQSLSANNLCLLIDETRRLLNQPVLVPTQGIRTLCMPVVVTRCPRSRQRTVRHQHGFCCYRRRRLLPNAALRSVGSFLTRSRLSQRSGNGMAQRQVGGPRVDGGIMRVLAGMEREAGDPASGMESHDRCHHHHHHHHGGSRTVIAAARPRHHESALAGEALYG